MIIYYIHVYIVCILIIYILSSFVCIRCMALSTVIFVGETKEWVHDIVEKARKLKVGSGLDPATEVSECVC